MWARFDWRNTHVIFFRCDWPSSSDETLLFHVAKGYQRDVHMLGAQIQKPELCDLIHRFLYDQANPHSEIVGSDTDISDCPMFSG